MILVKAPNLLKIDHQDIPVIFLAGGISDCPNWQEEATKFIEANGVGKDFILVNPRRDDFDTSNPEMTIEQIKWEHEMLERSSAILFWFPKDTLCPITLYELGVYTLTEKYLIIGVDPEYKRKTDISVQTGLRRNTTVNECWQCFLKDVREYLREL